VVRSRPSAPAAAARLIATAANAVPRTPNRGMRTNEVKRAPAIAPAVLAAYRRPPAAPTCPSCGARDRTRMGNVPPIRTAGTATSAKSSAQARGPATSSNAVKGCAARASTSVAATPRTATPSSNPLMGEYSIALLSLPPPLGEGVRETQPHELAMPPSPFPSPGGRGNQGNQMKPLSLAEICFSG
jgi:hypothetical protein